MENLESVYIIAEIGVNHDGNMDIARKMIDIAKKSGVNAVKFQNFKADLLCIKDLDKEEYQKEACGDDGNQYEMLNKLEISEEDTVNLKKYTEGMGLDFISTPYDRESVDILERVGVKRYKIGSGEISDLPFLEYIVKSRKPIILSTGASTLQEVKEAVQLIKLYCNDLTLLHCTSCYPTSFTDVNLNVMITLMNNFGLPVGYSDHTEGVSVAAASVALGAKVIEKHFTLDKGCPGPDHKASVNPEELLLLVRTIREVEMAMGGFHKKPCDSEQETISLGRRSIISFKNISKGHIITENDLIIKRPGYGIQPGQLQTIIGKRAKHDISKDILLSYDDLEEH